MSLELSVVIPCLNPSENLERILQSLQKISHSRWETVVVFNLKSQDGEQMAQSYGARTLTVGKVGVNLARNAGLAAARAPLVLFLDDDCEVANANLLVSHIEGHRQRPDVVAIGGLYALAENAGRIQRVYHRLAQEWMTRVRNPDGLSMDLLGGHVSYKKALLPKGMKFDPTIEFGGSETEFHLRIFRSGARLLLLPGLTVFHHSTNSLFTMARKGFCQGQTYSRLPMDLSDLDSRGVLKERLGLVEGYLHRIYAHAYYLGSRFAGAPPRSWLGFLPFLYRDMALHWSNRLSSLVNCRPLTNLHILLRLILLPRGAKERTQA